MTIRPIALIVAVALVLVLAPQPAVAADPSDWRLDDLGTLGGDTSSASAVNERGHVVGSSGTTNGRTHAFLWREGKMTDLGTLGGGDSWAYDINDAGQVVGSSQTATGRQHAFLWQDGVMSDLGALGGDSSVATAIDDEGRVVGWGYGAANPEHAFIWKDGKASDLSTPPQRYSMALAISGSGHVAGSSGMDVGWSGHPVLWRNGVMSDLGTLGGSWGSAYDVNALDQVVGVSEVTYRVFHAFLWQDGVMTDLDPLAGAHGINDRGQVVGESTMATIDSRAYLWQGGVVTDLGEGKAYDINERGLVVGWSGGHAAMWTDVTSPEVGRLAQSIPGQTIGTTSAQVRLRWTSLDAGSGVASHVLQRSVDGGRFETIGRPGAATTSADVRVVPGRTYRFRIQASDRAGNRSPYAAWPDLTAGRHQETSALITYAGAWSTSINRSMSGGAGRRTTSATRTVAFRFTGRDVAWVATRTLRSGHADVYIDGQHQRTIDLGASGTQYRRVVFQKHFDDRRAHVLEIRPIGDGRVDIDAFIVLR